jgi:hypothetical protein
MTFVAFAATAIRQGCESRLHIACATPPFRSTRSRLRYRIRVNDSNILDDPRQIGLCADCKFMALIVTDRGSTFYLCGRSATDPNFPKYPRLPVVRCRGYENKS